MGSATLTSRKTLQKMHKVKGKRFLKKGAGNSSSTVKRVVKSSPAKTQLPPDIIREAVREVISLK